MVKITLLNYVITSLFIQDKRTLYSDLLQSYDNGGFREDLHGHNYVFIVPI